MSEENQEARFIKRSVKDSVFSEIFSIPAYQVETLKALYPEEKDITEADIQDVTIRNVISTDVYNDLGLLFRGVLVVLIEAQSIMTANILIRFIEYAARVYKDYLVKSGQDWYGRKKVRIPRIDLYVVYVGAEPLPKGTELIRLSREFFDGKPCAIDVAAKVISRPMGSDAMSQYIRFSHISSRVTSIRGRTREAAMEIVDECISEGILPDFFTERRQEVLAAMVELFSQQEADSMRENAIAYQIQKSRREGHRVGRREGHREGIREGIREGAIRGSVSIYRDELGFDDPSIIRKISERFGLTQAQAEAFVLPGNQPAQGVIGDGLQ